MQVNKNIKIFINWFLGPLLFLWLAVSIYDQVMRQPHLAQSWRHIKMLAGASRFLCLPAVLLLMFVNWSLEARKWQLSVQRVERLSFGHAFRAILSGVSFSVTLPNRIGEYAGRLLYLQEGRRLRSVSLTIVGSISQLLVTISCGISGFLLLQPAVVGAGLISPLMFRFVASGLFLILLLLTLLYFSAGSIGRWVAGWRRLRRHRYLLHSLKTFNVQLLGTLLLLSFLRYLVFIVQYYLLFVLFGVDASPGTVWSVISLMFLVMAVIPTIALVEVGLRGSISLQLMGLFTENSLGVVLASVSIWLINLVLPALAGSILIFGLKVFKRKHENTL